MHSDQARASALLESAETLSARTSGRGVVVLSSRMQVLYMSGEAAALIKSMPQAETGLALPGIIPTVIEDFCLGIFKTLQTPGSHGISHEIRRIAGDPEQPILLRGFGLCNGLGIEKSHVVIIMEERSGQC